MILISRTGSALDPHSNSNSPAQREHLRYQMVSILHTLSSTFTTCACGAMAKDCALSQMAAFVDGELPQDSGRRNVNLGPLVGATRGFKTRERVPMSGGMSGVEMDTDSEDLNTGPLAMHHGRRHTVGEVAYAFRLSSEQHHDSKDKSLNSQKTSLPALMLSPATASPSPKKVWSQKGKERAVFDNQTPEEWDEATEVSSSGESRIFKSESCLPSIKFWNLGQFCE